MFQALNRLSCSMYGRIRVIQVGPQQPGLEVPEHGPRPFQALIGSQPGWAGVKSEWNNSRFEPAILFTV